MNDELTPKNSTTGSIETTFAHPSDEELAIINTRTQREFTAEELYVLTVHMCNNIMDKTSEVMDETFLNEFAAQAQENNLAGQLNHTLDVRETWANIFEAHVEKVKDYLEVVGRAYVLNTEENVELLKKIEAGSIGGISIQFDSEYELVDGVIHHTHCVFAREFSLVVTPCLYNTGITKELPANTVPDGEAEVIDTTNTQKNGGHKMKFLNFFIKQAKACPATKSDADETVYSIPESVLDGLENEDLDRDMTEQEIALSEEIDRLKAELAEKDAKIEELTAQLEAAGKERETVESDAINAILDEEVEKMFPGCEAVAKDSILKSLDRSKFTLKDGKLEDAESQLEAVKKSWEPVLQKTNTVKKSFTTVSHKATNVAKKTAADMVAGILKLN